MTKKPDQLKSEKIRDKYRMIIYNDQTFEEVGFIRLSRLSLIALVSTIFILIVAGVFTLIAYTGVRELIPGYPDGTMRRSIIMNAIRLD